VSGEGALGKPLPGDLKAGQDAVIIVHSLPKIFVIIFLLYQSFNGATGFLQGSHEALELVLQAGDATLESFEINLFVGEKGDELLRWR
jgi:hypothetical protein